MASPQAQAIKDLYNGWIEAMAAKPDMPLEELRDLFEHWGDLTGEPGGVDYLEVDAGGVRAMWAVPEGCSDEHVALCTHGGGYVCGSMYSHRKMYAHLAKAIGSRALIVDYRRAPENPHPAPVEDTLTAYAWLLDQGYEPGHICTTGDSAGGALATAVLLGIREQGLPMPAAAMPMSPWYDPEGTGESVKTNAEKEALVSEAVLKSMASMFLGDASSKDPRANLLQADLTGLPPIYIQVGGDETLLDDSLRFEKLAREAGLEVTVDVYPEMQHCFHFMAGRAPEADDAVQKLAAWVKPKLGL
ncbi:MAG: alpha/beta hydrolase [Gammaproteobacteria bacterium]